MDFSKADLLFKEIHFIDQKKKKVVTQQNQLSTCIVQSDIPANASNLIDSQSWIIDSKATNDMTRYHDLFSSYSTCSGKDKVRIADGTLSSISGNNSFPFFSSMSPSSVWHVSNFSHNLQSISSITKLLNCSVTIFPTHCIFQELHKGKWLAILFLLFWSAKIKIINKKQGSFLMRKENQSEITTEWLMKITRKRLVIIRRSSYKTPNIDWECEGARWLCSVWNQRISTSHHGPIMYRSCPFYSFTATS